MKNIQDITLSTSKMKENKNEAIEMKYDAPKMKKNVKH